MLGGGPRGCELGLRGAFRDPCWALVAFPGCDGSSWGSYVIVEPRPGAGGLPGSQEGESQLVPPSPPKEVQHGECRAPPRATSSAALATPCHRRATKMSTMACTVPC